MGEFSLIIRISSSVHLFLSLSHDFRNSFLTVFLTLNLILYDEMYILH